jgi:hypothetical protein
MSNNTTTRPVTPDINLTLQQEAINIMDHPEIVAALNGTQYYPRTNPGNPNTVNGYNIVSPPQTPRGGKKKSIKKRRKNKKRKTNKRKTNKRNKKRRKTKRRL